MMGMSVEMRKSYARALVYNSVLLATDKRFNHWATVEHQDGSRFVLACAFLITDPEDDGYLWLMAEHSGVHVFCKEDLAHWREFKRIG